MGNDLVTRELAGAVVTLRLSRPEQHNAFTPELLAELRAAVDDASADPAVRVIVLAGRGPSFSAGADLGYMRAIAEQGEAANEADALALADTLAAIRDCTKPVLARVHGAAIGGGSGLVAAADLAIAAAGPRFAFSEVRLGLVPAVIAPFVLDKLSPGAARSLFLTGEPFGAERALALGLVHEVVPEAELDAAVARTVTHLLAGGPEAQATVKQLLAELVAGGAEGRARARDLTARTIAERRASAEGQAGMRAFLERRPAPWRSGEGP
jgi:methylglutaconyl-CoA hydratase